MNRGAAVSLIAGRLGNRTGLSASIAAEITAAQEELEQMPELPWFLINKGSLATDASPWTIPTAFSGFIREVDEQNPLWYQSTTDSNRWEPIIKDDYEVLRANSDLDGEGTPQYYAIVGDLLYLFPKLSTVYAFNFEFFYFKKDTVMTLDADENNWLKNASALLIAKAGLAVARFLRDPEGVKLFTQDYNLHLAQLGARNAARQTAGMHIRMGDRE